MLETNLLKNLNDLTKLAFSCFPEKESVVTIYNPFTDPLMVEATYCPTCGKPAKNYQEAELIRGLGECLRCEHVRGEYMDEMKAQYSDETNEDKWLADAYIEEKICGEELPEVDDGQESEDR